MPGNKQTPGQGENPRFLAKMRAVSLRRDDGFGEVSLRGNDTGCFDARAPLRGAGLSSELLEAASRGDGDHGDAAEFENPVESES